MCQLEKGLKFCKNLFFLYDVEMTRATCRSYTSRGKKFQARIKDESSQ